MIKGGAVKEKVLRLLESEKIRLNKEDLGKFERATRILKVRALIGEPRGLCLPFPVRCPECNNRLATDEWFWEKKKDTLKYYKCPKCDYEYASEHICYIDKLPGRCI